ncbi:hypothetical protein [Micromonospora aurantiaca (nom. illeg.)]|uniref:hypothetical protein n=1 Tax=Micromonospora aurantiaca (nom. illeg.) TaxID=47850 RepID=UPI003EBD3AF1
MTPDASPTVDRLAGLFDWDGATETEIDWTALTEAAGHPFPEDYRRFVERFPHGSIGFLEVLHPSDWGVPEFLRYARNWHHVMNKRAECTGGFPYHFGTSPGDLRSGEP